jgi:hypothetical protein
MDAELRGGKISRDSATTRFSFSCCPVANQRASTTGVVMCMVFPLPLLPATWRQMKPDMNSKDLFDTW